MNFQTFSSYAALLYRFALLLFAILPVTYGTPWLSTLLFVVIALCFVIVLPFSYVLYKRNLRQGILPNGRRKARGLHGIESHPRDRYYDVMICIVGFIIYGLTGVTFFIILWAVVLVATLFSIVANPGKGLD